MSDQNEKYNNNNNSIEILIRSLLQLFQKLNHNHNTTTTRNNNHHHRSSCDDDNEGTIRITNRRPYILLLKHSQQQQFSLMNRYNDDISSIDSWKLQYQSQQQSQQPWLQCNELWLEYIATTIFEQHNQQQRISVQPKTTTSTTTLPSTTKNKENAVQQPSILYISTLPGSTSTKKITSTINILQSKYGTNRIHVIPIHTIGSIMNNDDDNDDRTSNTSIFDLDKLDTIITVIQNYFNSSSSISKSSSSFTTIMIDSLTPIFIRHGYDRTIQFLQQIITVIRQYCCNSFLLLPIRIEMLSLQQLHNFEDTINVDAILNVTSSLNNNSNNQITYNSNTTTTTNTTISSSSIPINTALLLRRGVQQRDHIRRDIIHYTFNTIPCSDILRNDNNNNSKETATTHPKRRYQIQCISVDQNNDRNNTNDNTDGDTVSITTKSLDTTFESNDTTTSAISSLSISNNNHQQRRTMNIQMNDGQRIGQSTISNTNTVTSSSTLNNIKQQKQVPNIYMQDDDPEFIKNHDDYDEEDPDDDLDL